MALSQNRAEQSLCLSCITMTIALVLDTNVLRQEGLTSRNMQLLSRLSQSGELNLYVPDIVAREFTSQRVLNLQSNAAAATAALAEMAKQVDASRKSRTLLNDIQEAVLKAEKVAKRDVEADFERWIASTKANVLEFDAAHLGAVFDDYFVGAGAFRSPKHRNDIPDAVVSAQIRALLKRYEKVHIAVKDKEFKRHLQNERRYLVVDELKEFFALQPVISLIAALDAQEQGVEAIKALLATEALENRLSAYLRTDKETLRRVYVQEDDIEGLDVLGMRLFGASINFAQADAITDIEYGEVSYLEQGGYSVDVLIKTRAQIHYGGDYAELINLPSTREVESVSMDGEGICDLIEQRDVALKGYLVLVFDKNFSAEVLEAHSRHLGSETSEIEIYLDIKSAVVF